VLKQYLEEKKNKKGYVNSVSVANDESNDSEVSAYLISVKKVYMSWFGVWSLALRAIDYRLQFQRKKLLT
jgi:hypothetical protein